MHSIQARLIDTSPVNKLLASLVVAVILTYLSIGMAMLQGWISNDEINWFEVAATFASYSCTYMCVVQTRWNYPMGILATSLLAWVFWESNLLASAALNIYLIPTVIYGFFIWGRDSETRPVEHVRFRVLWQYFFFTVAAFLGAWVLVNYLGGSFAPLDSWLLIGSILAQFLLDRKKIETWTVWCVVNVVSIYVYFESGLYLLAIQFTLFLLNSVFGYYMWHKTMKNQH